MAEIERFIIVYFTLSDGRQPVRDFINALDVKMRADLFHRMELLEEFGTLLRKPYSDHIYDGIFELRIQSGGNIARILFFFAAGRKIIMTNGFTKKTRSTPKKQIELAIRYKTDFERR
jgi:phage-related protein